MLAICKSVSEDPENVLNKLALKFSKLDLLNYDVFVQIKYFLFTLNVFLRQNVDHPPRSNSN